MDAATLAVAAHGFSELVLAFKMSLINVEQMKVARAASKAGKSAGEAAAKFLQGTYYKSWSRAQLNNTEYAPMLALLCFALKYKADKEEHALGTLERYSCIGSVFFSYIFIYAAATQKAIDIKNMRPGQAGMSPLRPLGAMGRYFSMALLLYCLVRGDKEKKRSS